MGDVAEHRIHCRILARLYPRPNLRMQPYLGILGPGRHDQSPARLYVQVLQ